MKTATLLYNVFAKFTNGEIAETIGENYNTVAAWRFKFHRNMLSLEKQIEILTKLNYQVKTDLTWKTNRAK
jgi:hypothetical protein